MNEGKAVAYALWSVLKDVTEVKAGDVTLDKSTVQRLIVTEAIDHMSSDGRKTREQINREKAEGIAELERLYDTK